MAILRAEHQETIQEGQGEEQEALRPRQGGDGEDGRREGGPARGGAFAQVEDHPPQREQDEERDLHPREGGPHEPARGEGEPRGQGGEAGREAELAGEAPGGVNAGEVEGDAEGLGPGDDVPGEQEKQREQGRPQGGGRAGHEVAGVVGETEAAGQIASELQMDPTVVERKPKPALQAGDLRQQVAQADHGSRHEEERAGREAAPGGERIFWRDVGRGHGSLTDAAEHTQLAKTGL